MIKRNIEGDVPVVVFIGIPNCGKSMVMMSLIDYLVNTCGLTPRCNTNYMFNVGSKSANDADRYTLDKYFKTCDEFRQIITKNAKNKGNIDKMALDSTSDQILVDVNKQTKTFLRMLEVPGEDFFKANDPDAPIEAYLRKFLNRDRLGINGMKPYPVYFVMLLDRHTDGNFFRNNHFERGQYEDTMIEILQNGYNQKRGDRIVLLYNKADLSCDSAETVLQGEYPKLKEYLTKKTLFSKKKLYSGPLDYVAGCNFHMGEAVVPDPDNPKEKKTITAQLYDSTERSIRSAAALWKHLNPEKSLF